VNIDWFAMNKGQREALVRHYIIDQAWTYGQIAAAIGVTRNVIAGVCNRGNIRSPNAAPGIKNRGGKRKAVDTVVIFPSLLNPVTKEAATAMAKVRAKKHSTQQSGAVMNTYMRLERERTSGGPRPDIAILKADIWKPLPGSTPIDIEFVGANQCRWPVSDDNHKLCGEKTRADKVYCAAHCAAAYRPAPPINFKKNRHAKSYAA